MYFQAADLWKRIEDMRGQIQIEQYRLRSVRALLVQEKLAHLRRAEESLIQELQNLYMGRVQAALCHDRDRAMRHASRSPPPPLRLQHSHEAERNTEMATSARISTRTSDELEAASVLSFMRTHPEALLPPRPDPGRHRKSGYLWLGAT